METQAIEVKRKRLKKRRLDLQLEACLREAEAASRPGVDVGLRTLIQARLQVLNHRLNKQEAGKLDKALAEIGRLNGEIERLNAELKALDPKGTSPDLDAQAQQMLKRLYEG